MNRLLTYTAVGLFLGLAPAVAETDNPAAEQQTPPAMQEPSAPAAPTEAVPLDPQEPGAPIPGDTTQVTPGAEQPDPAAPPAQSEAQKPMTPSEAPPVDSAATLPATGDSPQFLSKQERSDWLSSNLVGLSVVNANNESIGSITDMIADENGKVVGVLIGAGGFLGIGQKDVAIRFEDLKLARDQDDNVTALVDISQDTLASAPDYETLAEQRMTVGSDQPAPASQ